MAQSTVPESSPSISHRGSGSNWALVSVLVVAALLLGGLGLTAVGVWWFRSGPSLIADRPPTAQDLSSTAGTSGKAADASALPREVQAPHPADQAAALQERLAASLHQMDLPSLSNLAIEEEVLLVALVAESCREKSITKPEMLLPVLLLTHAIAQENAVRAAVIEIRAPLPDGDWLMVRSPAETVNQYLAGTLAPHEFAAAVEIKTQPWEPDDGTREEIVAQYFNRGQSFIAAGDFTRALPMFQEVYALDSGFSQVNKAIALCLQQTKGPVAALPYLRSAWTQDPADPKLGELTLLIIEQLFADRQYAQAEELTREFLAKENLNEAAQSNLFLLHCASLFQLDQYKEAESVGRELTSRFPDVGKGWFWLARSLIKRGEFQQALPFAQKAAELDPDYEEAHYIFAMALQENGNFRAAAQNIERAKRMMLDKGSQPSENLFINLSYCYAKLNDMAMASKTAAEGLQLFPDNEALRTNYKITYKAQLKK